jgi:hypothetical protein
MSAEPKLPNNKLLLGTRGVKRMEWLSDNGKQWGIEGKKKAD